MKIRNKKTGLTGKLIKIDLDIYEDGSVIYISILLDNSGGECIDKQFYSIDELKKFLEEWEDCTPPEPYIKDEKVRKFVRVWADANEVTKVYVYGIGDGKEYIELYAKDDGVVDGRIRISLPTQDGVWIGEEYTIPELCGEEEE